jgi:EAL domain-containing protein (putative c-di-GMP-specific phosphodiesterase class I)
MLEDAEDRTLVAGIVGLARNFRRASIAEGVETDAHMQALRELGCDMAQGHAIAPPMPLPELLAWCRERNRSRR